jgi:hypothetical protein
MPLIEKKNLPQKEKAVCINVPHLSGFPAGFGTAAFRGCRASKGRIPLPLLISNEL